MQCDEADASDNQSDEERSALPQSPIVARDCSESVRPSVIPDATAGRFARHDAFFTRAANTTPFRAPRDSRPAVSHSCGAETLQADIGRTGCNAREITLTRMLQDCGSSVLTSNGKHALDTFTINHSHLALG